MTGLTGLDWQYKYCIRTVFGQKGIDSMENFVHVIDYKDFYPTIYEEPTALSRFGLMDKLVIKPMFAQDPH